MKVLVFGAHPDDIEIGAGGTIAKLVANGHVVDNILVSIPNQKDLRSKESVEANKILGSHLQILNLDTKDLIDTRSLVQVFDSIISSTNPDIIFTHWVHDSHQDHVLITRAVLASTRKNQCSVYMYDQTIPGGIVNESFQSQIYVDISNFMDKKIESTLAHKSQVKNNTENWIKGIEGRARYYGYQIGKDFAETFQVIKQLEL